MEATLQERPEKEIGTAEIGAFVMEELKKLDKVAYVRFASVYRHFRDIGEFMNELKRSGVGCSVHWRPLHLHPYYQKTFGWRAQDFPVATAQWKRLVSLPIFPGMREDEIDHVIQTIRRICTRHAR